MRSSARLQVLSCLMLYVGCAQAIMVKFGTKGGPIEPPPPETTPQPPQPPFRDPAPVWEDRTDDKPDPNAQWRSTLFIPQPRYTNVAIAPPSQKPITNAQSFVNSYLPKHKPVQVQPVTNYFTPSQLLSSQNLPGFGIRYFMPVYWNELHQKKEQPRQEDAKINQIETNEVEDPSRESASDAQWKYEKDAARRVTRHTIQVSPYPYVWPAFVPRQH